MSQCSSCGGFCGKSGCERENVGVAGAAGLGEELLTHDDWDALQDQCEEMVSHNFRAAMLAKLREKLSQSTTQKLLEAKQHFERNFGQHWQADWIYSDLLEWLDDTAPASIRPEQCMDHGECFGGKCIYPPRQPEQAKPDGHIHFLVDPNTKNPREGVFLGSLGPNSKEVCEQAHTEGETYSEVIPIWLAPPPRQPEPMADEMKKQMKDRCDSMEMRGAFADGWISAEAAHGITKEKS